MPIHTPSPHRFLAPNPPSKSKPKPQSGLRNVQTPATTKKAISKPDLQFKKLTPAKRFVIAPPRHHTSADDESDAWKDSHTHTPRPKPRRPLERVDSIEEPSQSSQEGVLQSIEHEPTLFDEALPAVANDEDDELLFETTSHTKRRRISPETALSPIPSRFKPAPIVYTPNPATAHKPHFILPALPTSPPKTSRPLPEIFSPTRKQGKYIPGGLASTVTGWIIETANTGSQAGGVVWGREREDGVKMRVRLTDLATGRGQGDEEEVECYTGGVTLVRGKTEIGVWNASRASSVVVEERGIRVLLAGQGGARGSSGVRIKRGSVVGIKAPMWDVELQDEKWAVAVDWVVL